MTEPGTAGDVPEADRAEQEALVDPPESPSPGTRRPRRPTSRRPTRSSSSSSPGRGHRRTGAPGRRPGGRRRRRPRAGDRRAAWRTTTSTDRADVGRTSAHTTGWPAGERPEDPAPFDAVAAVLVVVLILVGLPLLAWWLGGRRFWSRLRPGAEPDPWRDAVRRHGLSPAEASRLAREVPRGAEFQEPRLRRAAVDWAGTLLEQEMPRQRTAVGRWLVALLFFWALAVLGLLLHRLLAGQPEDVNWLMVATYAVLAVWILRRRRNLRRTIERNSDDGS